MDGTDLRTSPAPDHVRTRDGVSLFTRAWGAGQPVAFVHSWAAHSEMWRYQMADLAHRGHRCIAYDRRGHGRSGDVGRGYDYDSLADDLASVIAAFDVRDAVLVGHSMAGGEIVRYLTRHGADRVAKIVLLAPTTPCVAKRADNPNGVDPAFFEGVRAQWRADFTGWLWANIDPFLAPETPTEVRRWLAAIAESVPLDAAQACNVAMVEADFRDELRAITVPTLVIHGDADASTPIEISGRPTAELVPGAKLIVYEGAPHGLFVTHRQRLNDDLAAFIAG